MIATGVTGGGQSTFGDLTVFVGEDDVSDGQFHLMNGEIGSILVTLVSTGNQAFTVGIEMTCWRTDRAYFVWQEKAYASIAQSISSFRMPTRKQ